MRSRNRKSPALDLASNYDELAKFTRFKLNDEVKTFGLELTKFVIENISLPQEVEAAMDKRTSMGVLGDVGRYTQFQAADAMRDAAQNPGGAAGTGMGLGAGFALGNAMAGRYERCCQAAEPGQPVRARQQRAWRVRSVATKTRRAQSSVRNAARKQGPATCANCQAELYPGAKFCNECGQKV
jgi:membrane protease subunit (stomatin/prohibitin family)